jgi:hypothetical protein
MFYFYYCVESLLQTRILTQLKTISILLSEKPTPGSVVCIPVEMQTRGFVELQSIGTLSFSLSDPVGSSVAHILGQFAVYVQDHRSL